MHLDVMEADLCQFKKPNNMASFWRMFTFPPFPSVLKVFTITTTSYITASTLLSTLNELIWKYIESKVNSRYQTEVLFFPDATYSCRCRISTRHLSDCDCRREKSTMEILIKALRKAVKSLDICMFTISSAQLANIVLQLHAKGIVVRIITDEEKDGLVVSQIYNFRASGIQVRHDKTSFLMHNKFIIIDGETLVNGSFNWTNQAVYGNKENVLITNYPPIVRPYLTEFEKLWKEYSPMKDSLQYSIS